MLSNFTLIGGASKRGLLTHSCPDTALKAPFYPVDDSRHTFEEANLNQADRMRDRMDMQGLLAVLEADEADLLGRREERFSPVPLTGVQMEVRQQMQNRDRFLQIILRQG